MEFSTFFLTMNKAINYLAIVDRKNFIIGISGGSGSGKTTFLNDIKSNFTEEELCILSQDDYYLPREQQFVDANGIKNFDLLKSIDGDAFHRDICQLIDGREVVREEYTFNNPLKKAAVKVFKPSPIIMLEGIFTFSHQKIFDLLDFKIFIHASDNLKLIRRIKRDRMERNYPLDDVLYRYEHHVMPTYEKHIKPYMAQADIIINNNSSYKNALDMVVCHLKAKL